METAQPSDADLLTRVASGDERAEARPGQRWATAVVPVTTAWALVRPLAARLPVFPYASGGEYGDWTRSAQVWTSVGLLAAVLLGLVLTRESRLWEGMAS